MGGLAERATKLHKRIFTKIGKSDCAKSLPLNEPIKTLCEAIYESWYSIILPFYLSFYIGNFFMFRIQFY